jgi:hypothetical protein
MPAPREMPEWAKEILAKTDTDAQMENMRRTEPDFKWFHEHFRELQQSHPDEHVAIRGGKIIASNKDFRRLLAELESRSIDTKDCHLDFVRPENLEWVL